MDLVCRNDIYGDTRHSILLLTRSPSWQWHSRPPATQILLHAHKRWNLVRLHLCHRHGHLFECADHPPQRQSGRHFHSDVCRCHLHSCHAGCLYVDCCYCSIESSWYRRSPCTPRRRHRSNKKCWQHDHGLNFSYATQLSILVNYSSAPLIMIDNNILAMRFNI